MTSIDLNCDMGEGMLHDAAIMPFISSANIACGFHAGDADTIKRTVELALHHKVAIGAHPGFYDKENFGRTEMFLSDEIYYDLVLDQLNLLKKITDSFNTKLHHVKPHGALYNMAARNKALAAVFARAIKDFDDTLILYGLSGSYLIKEAKALQLQTASEVFADRTYLNDGSLTPRSQTNALIQDEPTCIKQVLQMVQHQTVTSAHNKIVPVVAETICIHGDGAHAVEFAMLIHQNLKANHIAIKAK